MSSQTHARQTIRGNPDVQTILSLLLRSAEPLSIADIREKTGHPPEDGGKISAILRRLTDLGLASARTEYNRGHRYCTYTIPNSAEQLIRQELEAAA